MSIRSGPGSPLGGEWGAVYVDDVGWGAEPMKMAALQPVINALFIYFSVNTTVTRF